MLKVSYTSVRLLLDSNSLVKMTKTRLMIVNLHIQEQVGKMIKVGEIIMLQL